MQLDSRQQAAGSRQHELVTHGAQRDAAIAAAFALATIVTRLPFRSHRVFNWDAVNFVLALHDYDVRLHHPHPPGYPVFVAMGRVAQLAIPDANNALVAVAMLLSAGAGAALFLLGRTLFGRATGVIAALYLLFSVTFWTNGAVALAYPSLALFTTLVALFAWRCRRDGHTVRLWTPLALSAAYAIGGGFRPDLLLFLLPLWIYAHWRLPLRTILLSCAVVCVIVLAWFIPTIVLSGGWSGYWAVFRAYTSDDVLKRYSVAENGPHALIVNLRDTAKYTGYALYALALPVAGAVAWLLSQAWEVWKERGGRMAVRPYIWLFVLWVTPMVLFYAWVHIGDPGYVFTFVPALLLIAARFTAELPRLLVALRLRPLARVAVPALVALVVVANTGIFLFRPLTLTAHGIRQQDRTIDGKIAYVRSHGDPATTLLVSYESYRHWLLYLPEYHVQFVDVTYGTEQDRTVTLPPGTTHVVIMDATLLRALDGSRADDVAAVEVDRIGVVTPPPGAPLHFAPIASPLGSPPPKL
ncbi:MAG: protein O-mannosyl-transferase family [Thermomicrobiales bacterium]